MNNLININTFKYYYQFEKLLNIYQNKELVFFCAGNYKVWYDCFASEVANVLKELKIKCFIYGGNQFSILPENLSDYIHFVQNKHPNACVIVVDNLLTFDQSECGQIIVSDRSTNISAMCKNIAFGNISLLLKNFCINP